MASMRQDEHHEPFHQVIGVAVTAGIAVVSILSSLILKQFLSTNVQTAAKAIYSDDDGEATKASQALCTANIPSATITAASAGALSVALYNRSTSQIQIINWILLSTQALVIAIESRFAERYMHGIRLASSAALALLWTCYEPLLMRKSPTKSDGIEICSLLIIVVGGLSIPRRPTVFRGGKNVDREFSVSFLGRLSFAWGPFHQSRATVPKSMKMDDMPEIGHSSRLRVIRSEFEAHGGVGDLWKRLIRAFWPTLLQQWLFVFITAFSQFGSRFALFKLLQALETQPQGSGMAGVWVLGLGLALLTETFSKSWRTWITQMRLQIPIESMLKTFVLEKTTRKQLGSGKDSSKKAKQPGSAEAEKLSLTDLVSNDCMEAANACAHTHHVLIVAFKLVLDLSYLAKLLGIKSVLVGGAASLLLAPLSAKLSRIHRAERSKRAKAHSAVSNLVSEAVQNLRHIRLSSTEHAWQKRLSSARDQELKQMWRADIAMAALSLVVNLSPVLLASLALSMYAFETGNLSSSVAFLSINMFNSLHAEVKELPSRLTEWRVSWSSYDRLQRFFDEPERKMSSEPSVSLELQGVNLGWDCHADNSDSSANFTLRQVDLVFPLSALSIITGNTGAGKSLLVAGLLDEAGIYTGKLLRPPPQSTANETSAGPASGSIALVSQPPWIENCTVLDNILFGSKYSESRYRKVLRACALDRDLGILPKGDQTVAGLNGAFLSGGQKWRVALARAFYSSVNIIILDDVLSAVDAHVAKQICEQALTGDLAKGRTIILVTHTPEACLAAAKYHVTVNNGTAIGKYLKSDASNPKTGDKDPRHEKQVESIDDIPASSEIPQVKQGKLVAISGKEVFSAYIWASGGVFPLCVGILVTLVARAAANSSSWWLTRWTKHAEVGEADPTIDSKIGIYLLFSFSTVAAAEIRSLILQNMSLHASRSLFQKLIGSVLYAPLSWIDNMPLGEMIQTLETDMYSLDNKTTEAIHNLLGSVIHLSFILVTSALSARQSIFFSLPIIFVYAKFTTQQLAISRQLMGLIDRSLRPILEHVTSVAGGLATIRAFGRTNFYLEKMNDLSDRGAKLGLHLILGQRWLAVRLGSLGAVFVTAVAAALVYQGEDAAKTGLIISLALQLQSALSGATVIFNIQNILTRTIGRIVSLAQIETESQEGNDPGAAWPENASIEVRNLVLRYNSSPRPALNNINFFVKKGQRLGIVGRTGAGKTSLTSALLRFASPAEGAIFLGGRDIATIKIERLRNALTLIPQDPFLFSGTLRSNVDPNGTSSDEAVREALRRVRLASDDAQDSKFSDLDMDIQTGGSNLSYGQRQLICMARALLIQCPVLILDEATSAVDSAVDAAIQQIIREEFQSSTILVVAHRLLTVADFDNILVLSDGEVAEFGPPAELMAKQGLFWDMVQKSGDAERIKCSVKEI